MSRFTVRDIAVGALFLVIGFASGGLALAGRVTWSVAALGVLLGVASAFLSIRLANFRSDIQKQHSFARANRRATRAAADVNEQLVAEAKAARADIAELKEQIATVARDSNSARAETVSSSRSIRGLAVHATKPEGRPLDVERPSKRPLGLVGFFGHGNYGDELFIDVFQQFLGGNFDLKIIPDLETKPYFSRPVEEKVAEVDAIVMGGGDLVQQWNTDPRYFHRAYLRKPLYLAGVGVPVYQGSERHQEKPHIIRRLRGFFGDPNVRLIGMRDDFSAGWIREKLEPAAPITSEPDIVCSLDLPVVSKPAGAPILGIVTRQRRVDTPDDYTRLEELAAHAVLRGFRIRHIILGTGSVGERDLANAPALRVDGKEVIHSEDLDALSRAIGECTVLASMKFHGTVVATMYGVPSIVLVPTNKNRNFMERIGRSELVARHDSERLIEIFGDSGPEPIDPRKVEMLRTRSTAFMENLRHQLMDEVANAPRP